MPLEKYTGIESIPASARDRDADVDKLADRIEFLWTMARTVAPGRPQGVKKFRSIEEANADRELWLKQRARRLRANSTATGD